MTAALGPLGSMNGIRHKTPWSNERSPWARAALTRMLVPEGEPASRDHRLTCDWTVLRPLDGLGRVIPLLGFPEIQYPGFVR